jgi:hypothetical protein
LQKGDLGGFVVVHGKAWGYKAERLDRDSGSHLFQGVEKEGDFDLGGVGSVGAVDDVGLDFPGEVSPDGAGRGLAVGGWGLALLLLISSCNQTIATG